MPKNLIVITKLFPYNFTEAFLESETPFLQEKFKNIIFMPLLKGSILTCINHYSSTEEHCSKKICS